MLLYNTSEFLVEFFQVDTGHPVTTNVLPIDHGPSPTEVALFLESRLVD